LNGMFILIFKGWPGPNQKRLIDELLFLVTLLPSRMSNMNRISKVFPTELFIGLKEIKTGGANTRNLGGTSQKR